MNNTTSNISSINQNDQSNDFINNQQINPFNQWILQQSEARRKREEEKEKEEFRIREQRSRMFRMKPDEIEQAYEDYHQDQVIEHEKWLDLEVQWLEDDYKEHLQQIEHLEELKQEKQQQNEIEQMKQLVSQERWEKKLLEYLVEPKKE